MKKSIKFFPVLFLLVFACGESTHPDYSKTKNGWYYKFLTIGDEDYLPQPLDFVSTNMEFKDEKGKVLEDSLTNGFSGVKLFQLSDTNSTWGWEEAVRMMSPGDSASFILPSAFFYESSGSVLKLHQELFYVNIKLIRAVSPQKYETIKAFESWLNQKDDHERKLLEAYLNGNDIKVLPQEEGLYYILLKEGKGEKLEPGSIVYVHYIGRFLDGTVFDNTYETGNPLELQLGVSDQVIKGMEIGISKMKRGGKAKFILPSHLAFGENGSSTGIIPPNTTVIYEVELITI